MSCLLLFSLFFFNATPTTEIYTLSLHDALPILLIVAFSLGLATVLVAIGILMVYARRLMSRFRGEASRIDHRSEEHTSELQSRQYLVCRLLLEKKKKKKTHTHKKISHQ